MQKLQEAINKIARIKDEINLIENSDLSKIKKKDKLKELSIVETHLMLEYASDPELFQYIKCWVVEMIGNSELPKDDLKNIIYDNNGNIVAPDGMNYEEYIGEIIAKSGGNIGHVIRNYLFEINFPKYSIAAQDKFWTINVYTTSEQADYLCSELHSKFDKAIKSKLFKII